MSVISRTSEKPATWLEIDLDKLRHNLVYLKSRLNSETGVLAVVKADAYGHGLTACAKALAPSVQYFGVSDLREAVQLRESGISNPILIYGFYNLEHLPMLLKYDLTASLSDMEFAEKIQETLSEIDSACKVKFHVKIDTGMSRLGFPYHTAEEDIQRLQTFPNMEIEGIFTHLAASSSQENDFTMKQLSYFETIVAKLQKAGASFRWVHSANSGGLLNFPSAHFNLVRPGIALYGLFAENSSSHELEPILQWKTKVVLVKDLNPGDTVSYGRKFTAAQPTRIAVLPVGYSHGYPVALSSKSHVLIDGRRHPVVGQVCMDHTVIELGADSPVVRGNEVTLIGRSEDQWITVTQVAKWAGTIPYEIVTRLNSSLPRIYIG